MTTARMLLFGASLSSMLLVSGCDGLSSGQHSQAAPAVGTQSQADTQSCAECIAFALDVGGCAAELAGGEVIAKILATGDTIIDCSLCATAEYGEAPVVQCFTSALGIIGVPLAACASVIYEGSSFPANAPDLWAQLQSLACGPGVSIPPEDPGPSPPPGSSTLPSGASCDPGNYYSQCAPPNYCTWVSGCGTPSTGSYVCSGGSTQPLGGSCYSDGDCGSGGACVNCQCAPQYLGSTTVGCQQGPDFGPPCQAACANVPNASSDCVQRCVDNTTYNCNQAEYGGSGGSW